MSELELMVGLFAYDTGCVDSGIHDNVAKANLFVKFHAYAGENNGEIYPVITEYATWLLSEDGIKQGYTLEDVKCFISWLSDNAYDI